LKTFLLLVTWFVHGQQPSSYQASFTSAETCEAAKAEVLKDAERLKRETIEKSIAQARIVGIPDDMAIAGARVPSVVASCVKQ